MGFLDEGTTLPWQEASKYAAYVREHGIRQFLHTYARLKDRHNDSLLWGDEVEYLIVTLDREQKSVRLWLPASTLLELLQREEHESPSTAQVLWRPEYGSFMIEGTPGQPYGSKAVDFRNVEPNMRLRREVLMQALGPNERALSMTVFPLMGCGAFTEPHYPPGGRIAQSLFVPDQVINPHPRFGTLTANIRERRGSKVLIKVPLFFDTATKEIPLPTPPASGNNIDAQSAAQQPSEVELQQEALAAYEVETGEAYDGRSIYMDAMCFGMGNSCLQCTFQCCNINEARNFYDQLGVLSPIMLALTAASPIFRGHLSDIDVRWSVISSSVDDRTREERGLEPLKNNRFVIPKSRYDSISCYISPDAILKPKYNDIDLVYDKEIFVTLKEAGIDDQLARHISHLFIRDPLVIYSHKIELDDEKNTDHFENLQSTNWQTMRFKPPPPNSTIGWRVEFRPMELQITDFENAAFTIFIVLLTRVLIFFELDFYIPLSKVDENMKKAHKRGAVTDEKFYFRKRVFDPSKKCEQLKKEAKCCGDEDGYELMTVNEIINGKPDHFPGLVTLIHVFLDTMPHLDPDTHCMIKKYLCLISKRASGELMTTAKWIRKFVRTHPDYQNDSVVSPRITYDLIEMYTEIANGNVEVPELFGNLYPPRACKSSSSQTSSSSSSSSFSSSSSSSSSSHCDSQPVYTSPSTSARAHVPSSSPEVAKSATSSSSSSASNSTFPSTAECPCNC